MYCKWIDTECNANGCLFNVTECTAHILLQNDLQVAGCFLNLQNELKEASCFLSFTESSANGWLLILCASESTASGWLFF